MSGVSSLTGGYGTTISLADLKTAENKKSAASAYADKFSAGASTDAGQSAGTSSEVVKAALAQAVKELSQKKEGRITFAKIAEYRQDLEKEFTEKMRKDLTAAGLPKDTEFTLTLSKEGSIQVQCGDEASKAAIKEYLSKNRDMCEKFGYIQALGSVEKADRRARAGGYSSLSAMKAEIQASAVSAFFDTALQNGFSPSSLNAGFGADGSAAFYSGVSALV